MGRRFVGHGALIKDRPAAWPVHLVGRHILRGDNTRLAREFYIRGAPIVRRRLLRFDFHTVSCSISLFSPSTLEDLYHCYQHEWVPLGWIKQCRRRLRLPIRPRPMARQSQLDSKSARQRMPGSKATGRDQPRASNVEHPKLANVAEQGKFAATLLNMARLVRIVDWMK